MKTSKTIFICMFPGQKVFHFCENKLCSICRTKLYQILQRQLLMWVERCMKTKIYIYIFILSWGTMQITSTHNYVMHHVLRYFLQMQHCRIMNFNLHIVEVIFEMSLWIWTQVFLALETRIKPSDKQATRVLNESTSWVRSDMLIRVCLSRWGTHLWRLLGRPLWQRRLSSTRWAQWLILSILTWSYVTCRICFLCFFV